MKTYHKVIVLGLALLLAFMFKPNPPHNRLSDVPVGNWVLIANIKDFSTVLDEDTVVLIEHSLLDSLSQDRRTALASFLEDGYPVAVIGSSLRPNLLAEELELNVSGSYGTTSKIVANGLFRIPEGRYVSFYVDGAVSTNEDIVRSIRSMILQHEEFLKRP